jgi:hypothetical protein
MHSQITRRLEYICSLSMLSKVDLELFSCSILGPKCYFALKVKKKLKYLTIEDILN